MTIRPITHDSVAVAISILLYYFLLRRCRRQRRIVFLFFFGAVKGYRRHGTLSSPEAHRATGGAASDNTLFYIHIILYYIGTFVVVNCDLFPMV